MTKGKFITLYGINNIGKSTQAKILIENLRKAGHEAVYIKYPVYEIEPSGRYLNKVLRESNGAKQDLSEQELQMWFTVNRFQFEGELKAWLEDGKIVVAEDYIGTGLSWGSAKGASLEWLEEINKYLLKEDLAIFLKGKRNLQAMEKNHIHESNDELMEACQFIMENLAQKHGWHKVSVQHSISETADEIWGIVEKYLNNNG